MLRESPRSLFLVLAALTLGSACAGPPAPSPISAEPVCPDFELGVTRTKMRGGLRLPVSVVIEQGKDVVMRTTVVGKRSAGDTPTRIILADANEDYTVEWGQCENERAPRPVEGAAGSAPANPAGAPHREAPTDYVCGKANVYKTDKLETKKGDLSSHALTFPAPPNAACWEGGTAPTSADIAPAASATPVVDAGAPEDAGFGAADASAPASSAVVDAGALPPADAGARGDAGAKKKAPADGG